MTFHRFVRRLHLYMGLFLLPWLFLYGVSSIPFSHEKWLARLYQDGKPDWTTRFDRPYQLALARGADPRVIGARILRDSGIDRAFGTYSPDEREFHVWTYNFWSATEIVYYPAEKRLVAKDRRFRWDQILTGMHARGGFQQSSFLDGFWAVMVDAACLGLLVWIASGWYMWWKIRQTRFWGFLALGGGMAVFAAFLAGL